MQLDADTLEEIRAILARNCAVEINVVFHDLGDDDALESVDISTSVEFDASASNEERLQDLTLALEDIKELLGGSVLLTG